MLASNTSDVVPTRAQRMPTSSRSSSRAEAWYSTLAFLRYTSPPSACMPVSYGNASARQYSVMAQSA